MKLRMNQDTETLMCWSLERYHAAIAAGIFDDCYIELLNGEIVEMTPPEPIHEDVGQVLSDYLRSMLFEYAVVRDGKAITLPSLDGRPSEPIPDIAIVKPQRYRHQHPRPDDIYLLIEIANSRPDRDLKTKRLTYARASIQEYWVFDLATPQMKVFRNPEKGDYQVQQVWDAETISLIVLPELQLSAFRMKQLALS